VDDARDLSDIVRTLTTNQLAFAQARALASNDREAAEAIGLHPGTVYNWPIEIKESIDVAVTLFRDQVLEEAKGRLRMLSNKAVTVLDEEMNPGQRNRLQAAQDVLNRNSLRGERERLPDVPTGLLPAGQHARGIDALYEAIRVTIFRNDGGEQDTLDSSEYATVDGVFKPSG